MKKGLAFRIQKREKAGKLKSEEETREEVQRVFFHFLSKALESCNRRVGFSSL